MLYDNKDRLTSLDYPQHLGKNIKFLSYKKKIKEQYIQNGQEHAQETITQGTFWVTERYTNFQVLYFQNLLYRKKGEKAMVLETQRHFTKIK